MEVVQFCNKGQYCPAMIGFDSFDSKRRNVIPGENETTHWAIDCNHSQK